MVQGLESWSLFPVCPRGHGRVLGKMGFAAFQRDLVPLLNLSSSHLLPSLNLSLEKEVASRLGLLGVLASLDHTGV